MRSVDRAFSCGSGGWRLDLFGGAILLCLALAAPAFSGDASKESAAKPPGDGRQIRKADPPAAIPGGTDNARSPRSAGANRPPVAVPDNATLLRNTSVAISVLANDYDPDPDSSQAGRIDPASVTITKMPRRGARLAISETGTVTYAPRRNFRGVDVFQYTVKDKQGAVSNPAKVTVTVK